MRIVLLPMLLTLGLALTVYGGGVWPDRKQEFDRATFEWELVEQAARRPQPPRDPPRGEALIGAERYAGTRLREVMSRELRAKEAGLDYARTRFHQTIGIVCGGIVCLAASLLIFLFGGRAQRPEPAAGENSSVPSASPAAPAGDAHRPIDPGGNPAA